MNLSVDLPVWRSMLYVPVNVDRYVEKAHSVGADAIILDLEDSIAEKDKEHARTLIKAAAKKVGRGGADVVVRINRPLRLAIRDLEASISPYVYALALPKTESAEHVHLLSEVVDELETQNNMAIGATRFIAMVETPGAFFAMDAIAKAHPRIVAITLGGEDFATATGMLPESDNLYLPKVTSLIANRAAGTLPLGFIGSVADYTDLDAFRKIIERSKRLGFEGAACIHPGQVKILNDTHRMSEDEVKHAERIVEANAKASTEGRGSFEVDGKMIDKPIVSRAERLLRRHQAIVDRERRSGENN